jgi:hypothetical protein
MARPPVFLSDYSFPSKDLSRRVLPFRWGRKQIQVPKRCVLLGIPDDGHGPEIPNVISCIFIVTLVVARKLRRAVALMIIGTLNNNPKFSTVLKLTQIFQCVCKNISKLYHFALPFIKPVACTSIESPTGCRLSFLTGDKCVLTWTVRGLYSVVQNII